jgi:hypothetical protein
MIDENLKERVLNLLEEYHRKTGGKCGLSFVNICIELSVSNEIIKPILNYLYKQKVILIREGINGKLIFKK